MMHELVSSLKGVNDGSILPIIVDNGSSSGEVNDLLMEFGSWAKIVRLNRNVGFVAAANIGIKLGLKNNCNLFMILHNDCLIATDVVSQLRLLGLVCKKNGIMGPAIYDLDGNHKFSAGRLILPLGIPFMSSSKNNLPQFVDFVAEVGLTISKEVIEKVGFFDERFSSGYFDYDICIRARRSGFHVVYVPSARVIHRYASTRSRLVRANRARRVSITASSNHFRFLAKYNSKILLPLQVFAFVAFIVPSVFLHAVIDRREREYLASLLRAYMSF